MEQILPRNRWQALLAGAFVFVALFLSYLNAEAISVSPLTFEINVNPGEKLENYITATNNDGAKTRYRIEAEDFVPIGEEGSVVLEHDAPAAISAKRWLSFEPAEFEIEPGASQQVKFTISVPLDAEPGGKYTSLLVSTAPIGLPEGAVGLAQKVGSLLLIRVAGAVTEKISIESFGAPIFSEYPPLTLSLRVKNSGTVHLKPAGYVLFRNWLGQEVERVSLPQLRVIPGTTRAIPIEWKPSWLMGKYFAAFVGIYGANNETLAASTSFWVVPWRLLTGIAIGGLVLFVVFWLMRRRIILASRILFGGHKVISRRDDLLE